MARVTHVQKAQPRFETKPVLDPETGEQKVIPVLRADGTPKTTKSGRPITRQVTEADKTRPLPNRNCEKCRKEIEVGQPYKWVKPKSGPYGGSKRVRCEACPGWRASELTGSAALSSVYAAQETAEDDMGSWDRETLSDLESILEAAAEGVREGAETYRESAQNIEDGFGHETSQSQELNDKADQLEASADELESAKDDLEEFDEDAARTEAVEEAGVEGLDPETYDWDEDPEGLQDAFDSKKEEWADDQASKVEDAIGSIDIP